MRRRVVVLVALFAVGCVRETVSRTVLGPADPLCQDPDADIDADLDAATDDADLDGGQELDAAVDALSL